VPNGSNSNPPDRRQVVLNTPRDILFWCREFQCTEEQIWAAMAVVGTDATDVELACRRATKAPSI
jgi:hypothetical protein